MCGKPLNRPLGQNSRQEKETSKFRQKRARNCKISYYKISYLTGPSKLCVTHQMNHKKRNYSAVPQGSFQKLLSGFFPLRGYSPSHPLNEKTFCQKTLSGQGGHSPPPLTENCRKFSLKNRSKRAKIGVFGRKQLFLVDFFLSGIGEYSPPTVHQNWGDEGQFCF